ncbi:MAG: alkaline phosphatase family protein [Acidobacteria bacterium]|nr:alkaline phosphatase family protein [Acidobacteriota bacterium]MBI3658695.1 alkaline phosphatase family protein [Acidobacteriota bacterium]
MSVFSRSWLIPSDRLRRGLCFLSAALVVVIIGFGFCRMVSAQTIDCSRDAGSLPNPSIPPGTPHTEIPIEHIIVIMQENRSFDSYFGRLNVDGYEGVIDGVTEDMSNPDEDGSLVHPFHQTSYCTKDTDHSWNGAHVEWNEGLNDQFVIRNHTPGTRDGVRAMGYYQREDLNYYYALANRFAVADRYFSSLLGPTYPNRFYLLTGTSFGHIQNDFPPSTREFAQPTIFDQLNTYGISWKYYFSDAPVLGLFLPMFLRNLHKVAHISQFQKDLNRRRLPQVVFLESSFLVGDEHPPSDIQLGQYGVARRINALMRSSYWRRSALFLAYDENGGFFDHVPPPPACLPDDLAPRLTPDSYPADFDRYGFRVPFVLVSPYAKSHYVSHSVYDHTSILKFIETKFNLPALTQRDANANDMLDMFNFSEPEFDAPRLPAATIDWHKLSDCLRGRPLTESEMADLDDVEDIES